MQSLSGHGRGVSGFLGILQCPRGGADGLFLPRLHGCHGSRRAFQASELPSTKNMDGKRQAGGGGGACRRNHWKRQYQSFRALSWGTVQRQEDPFGGCREVQVSALLSPGAPLRDLSALGLHRGISGHTDLGRAPTLVVHIQWDGMPTLGERPVPASCKSNMKCGDGSLEIPTHVSNRMSDEWR